jgi:hypothetical protein
MPRFSPCPATRVFNFDGDAEEIVRISEKTYVPRQALRFRGGFPYKAYTALSIQRSIVLFEVSRRCIDYEAKVVHIN